MFQYTWRRERGLTPVSFTCDDPTLLDCYIVQGTYKKSSGINNTFGRLWGLLFPSSNAEFTLMGTWTENDGPKFPCMWTVNYANATFVGQWFQNSSRGTWQGRRISDRPEEVKENRSGESPITNVIILGEGVETPPGYEVLARTPSGRVANTNMGNGPILKIAVLRQSTQAEVGLDFAPIEDIGLIWSEIEAPPDGWNVVQMYLEGQADSV